MARIRVLQQVRRTFLYDTMTPDELRAHGGQFPLFKNNHVGDLRVTNLMQPGVAPSSDVVVVHRLAVGAPQDVLRSWQSCHLELIIGDRLEFQVPVWAPPDDLTAISEDVGREVDAFVTPLDWSYLAWSFQQKPFCIRYREAVEVRVVQMRQGEQPPPDPQGDLRGFLDAFTIHDVV